jgi:general secretion pathway protein A
LTNLETKTKKLLQIVLIGQPELLETLKKPELRQLKQRIASEATLQGLDVIETERYIKSRIEQVGNGNFVRFDPAAAKAIHAISSGIPRRINQICEQILSAAENKRVRLINLNFVNEVLGRRSKSIFSMFSKKENL